MTNTTNTTKIGPQMVALGEKPLGRGKTTLIPIGVAFTHKDKQGYNVEIDRLPVDFNGRIVLRPVSDNIGRDHTDTPAYSA